MIRYLRQLLVPAIAAAALAGCVTDYAYRGGEGGGYYYGQPSTEYRYYPSYGGYPYPYRSGYGPGYPGYYGYGYPYGYGGYGGYSPYSYYPYYRPVYRRPPVHRPGDGGRSHNDRRPPWRNIDGLRPRPTGPTGGPGAGPVTVPSAPDARPRDDGSRMEQMIRRAQETRRREQGERQEP